MDKKAKRWRRLSTDVILDHERLKVTEDKVELPDGNQTTYVRHAPTTTHSVAMIAVNKKGDVLIEREYSYPPDKVMWQLPGGGMKPGETPEVAALRELAEEAGYSAKRTELLGYYYVNNRLSDKKQYIVLCTDLFEQKLAQDAEEFIEIYWMPKQRLVAMITGGDFDNINLLAALNIWFHRK
jgi:ADP-ribose pyrophosphatase